MVKFATDISAQKLTNANFAGQIEAIGKSQAVIEFDMEGKILAANENFLRTVGYALSDNVGRHHSMFVTAVTGEMSASMRRAAEEAASIGQAV